MDNIIKLFIQHGGSSLYISPERPDIWAVYTSLTSDDFRRLNEIGFVFVKKTTKVLDKVIIEPVYKKFWIFKIQVDKKEIPVYKEVSEIVMKAAPRKSTLEGK